jgi:hypothetical protein
MVNSQHPAIAAALEEALERNTSGGTGAQDHMRCILELLGEYEFVGSAGVEPLDRVHERRSGNCISLSCYLTSVARRAGLGSDEIFVAIAAPVGQWRDRLHAYVVLPNFPSRGDMMILIDPYSMRPQTVSPAEFIATHSVFVVFNDVTQAISRQEKLLALGVQEVGNQDSGAAACL